MRIVYLILLALHVVAPSFGQYDFLVAGHAYGHHLGTNDGLHPAFLTRLTSYLDSTNPEFLILAGDFVRNGTQEQYDQVESELDSLGLDRYYVLGNHDNDTPDVYQDFFNGTYGDTYYHFKHDSDLFVVLDQEQNFRSISDEQLVFLDSVINAVDHRHLFLNFHMLLWTGDQKYDGLLCNLGSSHAYMEPYSNYWDDVFPMLFDHKEHEIYIFTGDVGGRSWAISAFYDQCGHIHKIATGMGETADENFLKVSVASEGLTFELIPLDTAVYMGELTSDYTFYPLVSHPQFAPNDGLEFCSGDTLWLEGEVNELFDHWWAIDTLTISEDAALGIAAADTYAWFVSDGTCVARSCADVVEYPVPEPIISWEGEFLTSSYAQGNQWLLNNELIEGSTDQSLLPLENGVYQTQVEIDGCSGLSNEIEVIVVSLFEKEQQLSIYPNPADAYFIIEGKTLSFHLMDASGRVVLSNENPAAYRMISLSSLSPGIYVLHMKTNDGIQVQSIAVR